MKNFVILTESINYIEENLNVTITRNDIANHCFVSLSMLEKLFHFALGRSIKSYITRRRMTMAAKDVAGNDMSITSIAMKYQYNSVEVFTRAFKRVWNVNPSEYRIKWKFTGIFPKINYEYKKGDDLDLARKKVDMSDAYDYLREKKNTYVICFDINHLTTLNRISHKLGDQAILEEASRIDRVATDEMLMIRIGGDEFALLTGLTDMAKANEIMDKVLVQNSDLFSYEGEKYSLELSGGITIIPESLRYSDFFTNLHDTIIRSKK